ncbi:MAG: phosphoribosyltransferase, partial [Dehalococcoidales bacterium]|nr:phosphoribosyltransferase [Dehalococcoidales bacterium]
YFEDFQKGKEVVIMDTLQISKLKTFVIMPCGNNGEYKGAEEEADYVFEEIIKPAVNWLKGDDIPEIEIVREIDRNLSGLITNTIVKDLLDSDVVIVDATGRNPNVFLELGIRYALRNKITVVMAQEGTEIPFDIKGYRYIEYSRFKPEEARKKIAQFIREGLKYDVKSDSIVFDCFKDMSVTVPGIAESHGSKSSEVMQWEEYIGRIVWVCHFLEGAVHGGQFAPDAVIGISNGGLIAADLIGRQLFRGTPIISLWAKRFIRATQNEFYYFDNDYNNALVASLKLAVEKANKGPVILLLDDHLGTGTTAQQAIGYLIKQLGSNTRILFIPLVSRRIEYIQVIEQFLPFAYLNAGGTKVFNTSKDEFISHLNTKASFFPYFEKEISKGA